MPPNDSWTYQGRQQHGWFGHGTSPHNDADAAEDGDEDLFRRANAARRVDYAAHCIVAHVPRNERSRWNSAANTAVRDDLKTAVGAWYAASGLRPAMFRGDLLDPGMDDGTARLLRTAARGIVDARNHRDLGDAAADLADAAQQVGGYRWPRFVSDAARRAEAAASHGVLPGTTLVQAGVAGTAAGSAGVAVMGRIALRLAAVAAAPELAGAATALGAVTLGIWLARHGPVRNVPVQGFGPGDRGVAPLSAEVNGNTRTVLLYHGPPTSTPDTASQHTVPLDLDADGVLKDRQGNAVARLGADGQVVPRQGVDIPGLFHGPAATPPSQALPPMPGTSTTSDEERKALGRPETLPIAPAVPGTTATPLPAQPPAANVMPGREVAPPLPQVNERWGDGSPETVDQGHQDKHIPGTNNYIPGRSVLTADPQALLDAYSGKGQPAGPAQRGQPGFKERFDTGDQIIGTHVDRDTGKSAPTTRGTIRYSGKGAHIVPAQPLPKE